jgi:hypothetical protein
MFQCVLVVALCAAGPPSERAVDPEPPKPVYHHFNITITGGQRSEEQIRKLLAPLKVAKVDCYMTEADYRRRTGEAPAWLHYEVFVRSNQPYEKVQAVIKEKPNVRRVWPPPPHVAKRTVDKLPVPKWRVGGNRQPYHKLKNR